MDTELTPWQGNMSFENLVPHPNTGSDATVAVNLDDGDATVGQQVYFYKGTKTGTGNPVQKAGLANGKLYGIRALGGVPQSEYGELVQGGQLLAMHIPPGKKLK